MWSNGLGGLGVLTRMGRHGPLRRYAKYAEALQQTPALLPAAAAAVQVV